LKTLDANGRKKTIGGDEFYVTYRDDSFAGFDLPHPSAVAYVTDKEDGTYDLYFVKSRYESPSAPPVGTGNLTISLQYTCNIGKLWPPVKMKWDSNGALNVFYEEHMKASPKLHPPSPIRTDGVDLSKYDEVLNFGDSVMAQFTCTHLRMRRSNMYFEKNTGDPMLPETFKHFSDYIDSIKPTLGDVSRGKKSAILMNHGAWDLAKCDKQESFEAHLATLRRLVHYIQDKLPNVDLIWRGTTVQHVNRAADIERLIYVSTSRSKALHDAQVELMDELHIPVIDFYNYTFESNCYTKPGDAIHYQDWMLGEVLNEIYPGDEMTSTLCSQGSFELLQRDRFRLLGLCSRRGRCTLSF